MTLPGMKRRSGRLASRGLTGEAIVKGPAPTVSALGLEVYGFGRLHPLLEGQAHDRGSAHEVRS